MSFRIGQKVVCVDARPCPSWGNLPLRGGEIYTVVRACQYDDPFDGSIATLELAEVLSPHPSNLYRASRFRPVVERKTDTGFAVLEEIRKRETEPAPRKKVAMTSTIRTEP